MDNRKQLQNWLEQINSLQAKRQMESGSKVIPYMQGATLEARNKLVRALYENDYSDMDSIQTSVKSAKKAISPARVRKESTRLDRLSRIQGAEKNEDGAYLGSAAHDTFSDIMDQIHPGSRNSVREWDSQDVITIGKTMADEGETRMWTVKDLRKLWDELYGDITPDEAFGENSLR